MSVAAFLREPYKNMCVMPNDNASDLLIDLGKRLHLIPKPQTQLCKLILNSMQPTVATTVNANICV